ncbi:hypothetical protein ABBQ32_007272 [Trebouxia sp. C0010 RCD-2024]
MQVKYWLAKGMGGHAVYKYLLRRRPDQGELATCRVEFGGRSAPKGMSALTRHGVFDLDLSCGKEVKPIVAVNELNEVIVPFSEGSNILREPDMKGNPLTHLISDREAHQKSLVYISTSILAEGLTAPPPALLPAKFKGRPHAYVQYLNGGLLPYHDRVGTSGTDTAQPNELLLSCMVDLVGIYTAEPGSSTIPEQVLCWLGSQKVAMGSLLSGTYYADKIFLKGNFHADHITFERHTLAAQICLCIFARAFRHSQNPLKLCHDNIKTETLHRQSEPLKLCHDRAFDPWQGCPYRLEVFQTPNKGWGLRSWDLIPTGAFVIMYTGRYIRATHPPLASPGGGAREEDSSDDEGQDERHDDEYNFDILPRPYADCENVMLPLLPPENSWL